MYGLLGSTQETEDHITWGTKGAINSIFYVWKIANDHTPNEVNMQFKDHPRLGVKAIIPAINNKVQVSIRTDYDCSFSVGATQLWKTLSADISSLESVNSFKMGLARFLERFLRLFQNTLRKTKITNGGGRTFQVLGNRIFDKSE